MPSANVLYAMDRAWWNANSAVIGEFKGEKYTSVTGLPGVKLAHSKRSNNSGAGSIYLAAALGAKKIILLGFDCAIDGGKVHWHGDHPNGMGNAELLRYWPAAFAECARDLSHIKIINCSRKTSLRCFDRTDLETALCEL